MLWLIIRPVDFFSAKTENYTGFRTIGPYYPLDLERVFTGWRILCPPSVFV